MNKLTAEKCRERIKKFKHLKKQFGIAMETELSLQAYEIALPILEKQEKGDDGWIEWPSDRMFAPVRGSTHVDIAYADGTKRFDVVACRVVWEGAKTPRPQDLVIAYRVIENDGREG